MFKHGIETVVVDFHLHTKKDTQFKYDGEENDFGRVYIDALKTANAKIGIITNHNKFDKGEYYCIRKKAQKENIYILPGVELGIKEGTNGLHILIVFSPSDWFENGEDFINKFLDSIFGNIPNRENADTSCKKDFEETLKLLDDYNKDYFIVLAHVDDDKGFLKECGGSVIQTLANNPSFRKHVLAIQKSRNNDNRTKLWGWLGYEMALVEGSDPKNLDDIHTKQNKHSLLKIGEYSYDALKFALQNHKNRLQCELSDYKHCYIKEVSFIGGKLDGETLGLSPSLNTAIGIRGSGKSSLLELIRWGLECSPTKSDSEYKESLIKHAIGSGGKIIMTAIDENNKRYKIERIVGHAPTVFDEANEELTIKPKAVIKATRYFGQKDLSELSQKNYHSELLNKMLMGEIEIDELKLTDFTEKIENEVKKLIKLDELPQLLKRVDEKVEELKHKMSFFEEKGVNKQLEKEIAFNLDVIKLRELVNLITEVVNKVINTTKEVIGTEVALSYESEYNALTFAAAQGFITTLKTKINDLVEKAKEFQSIRDEMNQFQKDFNDNIVKPCKEEFAEIKRSLNEKDIEADTYVNYDKALKKNESLQKTYREQEKQRDTFLKNIKTLITSRNNYLLELFRKYEVEIKRINDSQAEIKIIIEFKGNRGDFKEKLRDFFTGCRLNDDELNSLTEQFADGAEVIADFLLNNAEKAKKITATKVEKMSEKICDNPKGLLLCQAENSVEILYCGKTITQLSLGQRASALILFILAQEENDVVIIDQPEDDLDSQIIYTELLQRLKEKKENIQFIFATHNPNIPVLGDAEKVIAVECVDEKFQLLQGNIDTKDTQSKIVSIMEGGQDAFNRRNDIYNSWKS